MSKFIDLTGQKFGKLTVKEFAGRIKNQSHWRCLCECGNEKVIMASWLKRQLNPNCGCYLDLTGQKFGHLTVVTRVENKGRSLAWLCRCFCGKETTVRTGTLKFGAARSCGCTTNKTKTPIGQGMTPLESLYSVYKRGAEKRKLSWELSIEQVEQLTSSDCHYCGTAPQMIKRVSERTGQYIYNGIDRVENYYGYRWGNVVPCCNPCNFAKGKRSYRDYMAWIDRLVAHRSVNP